jgi:small subunit ribosomal protein S11
VERVFQQHFPPSRNRSSPLGQAGAGSARKSGLFDAELDEPSYSIWTDEASKNLDAASSQQRAHRLHVFATKHNTHITLVQPPRAASETASLRIAGAKSNATDQKKVVDVLLSLSAGNVGFKKAGRGSYDAAFQLAAFVMRQMGEKGITGEIRSLEVVLRGFGAGREAVTKALLGTEGRLVRGKITAVVDATTLKQGGPRSKKPRRLG